MTHGVLSRYVDSRYETVSFRGIFEVGKLKENHVLWINFFIALSVMSWCWYYVIGG